MINEDDALLAKQLVGPEYLHAWFDVTLEIMREDYARGRITAWEFARREFNMRQELAE